MIVPDARHFHYEHTRSQFISHVEWIVQNCKYHLFRLFIYFGRPFVIVVCAFDTDLYRPRFFLSHLNIDQRL